MHEEVEDQNYLELDPVVDGHVPLAMLHLNVASEQQQRVGADE